MSGILGSLGGLGLLFNNYTAGSINLFFFWMTWTTLIFSHPPLRVEIIATFMTRFVFFLIPSLIFTLFDGILPSLVGKDASQASSKSSSNTKTLNIPVGRGKRKQVRVTNFDGSTFYAIGMTLGNIFLGLVIQAGLEYVTVDIFRGRRMLQVTSALPLPWEVGTGILKAMAMREILIYYPHRHIHNTPHSPLYTHHTHATPSTSSLNLTSTSPLDYLLLQFLPVYLPAIMLRFHLLTYLAFVAITSFVDALTYSQYDSLPAMFFVGRIAKRVQGHYALGGAGGFGWLGFLDWWHGTEVKWNKGGVMGVGEGGPDGEAFTDAVKKSAKSRRRKASSEL